MKKTFLTVGLGILILSFALAGCASRATPMPAEVTEDSGIIIIGCPPRPVMQTDFAVGGHYEGTGRISFYATEDIADAFEEFGWIHSEAYLTSDGNCGRHSLYVDARYDFQEVLAYLQSWNECHEMADFDVGSEIEADESTPTPTPTLAIFQTSNSRSFGRTDPPPTATPTPETASLFVEDVPIRERLRRYEMEWLTSQYSFIPLTDDDVLFIDWPCTILVTDAFSQTLHLKGPATVRFSEEEAIPTGEEVPTLTLGWNSLTIMSQEALAEFGDLVTDDHAVLVILPDNYQGDPEQLRQLIADAIYEDNNYDCD